MLLLTSVSSTPMELWGQDGSRQHSSGALTAHSWSSLSRILSLHIPRELKGVCKLRSKAPCSSALTQTCTERPKPWHAEQAAMLLLPVQLSDRVLFPLYFMPLLHLCVLLVLSLFKTTPTQSVKCCLVSINTAELWQASWREGHGSDTFHSGRSSGQFKVNESIIHIKIRCQTET